MRSEGVRPPAKRPLRRKVCFLCERELERVAKAGCGAMFNEAAAVCFWVGAIAQHGPHAALALGRKVKVPA